MAAGRQLGALASRAGGGGGSWRQFWSDGAADVAARLLHVAGLYYCISHYLVSTSLMVGPSMQPTFEKKGGVVLVEHLSPRLGLLTRGDVVTCVSPENPKEHVCKRVVGLPGDTVALHRRWGLARLVTVPQGHVWLAGDNVPMSKDSRAYGPVPQGLVRGRVVLQVWPPSRWQVVARCVPRQVVDELALWGAVKACKICPPATPAAG